MLLRREGDDIVFWSDFPHAPAHRRIPLSTPGLVGARALRGERGLLYGRDYTGAPVIAFAEGVPGTDWVVVSRLDDRRLLRALRGRAALFTLGFAALGLLAGLALVHLLRGEAARTRRGLGQRRALLLRAVEQSSEVVMITDAAGLLEYVNPAFTRATGYTRAEVLGKNPSMLNSGRQSRGFYEELWATLARGEAWHGHFVNKRKDGTLFHEEAAIAPVRRGGRTVHYIAVKRDVSRERRLAEQFLQAQKMEPLGLLAGGVAHDINNLLTAVSGYGELIAAGEPSAQTAQDVQEILRASARAAALTRQLLSFGRKGAGKAELLDLNAAVAAIQKLLRRVLRENIELHLDPSAGPAWALIDPTALDQAILNLVVNARDAMPDGGTVSIGVDVTDQTPSPSNCGQDIMPGLYARLSVADTGIGMSPEVKARVFEPFFTTKPAGQGTGLGLAIVRTVADGADGRICVESEPGHGTTFRLYLPLAAAPSPAHGSVQTDAPAPRRGAGETVLIVEDDDDLRRMIERVLKAQGYTALACRDAEAAGAVEAAHRGDIHAALCDIVLPGMDGRAFAAQLRRRRPEVRTVLMTGHAPGPGDTDIDLLVKPFTMAELCRRVYDAVDARRTS
ncbi:MAG: PAS domain S-box protein [Elusimicrobia bacterium]|nr:PAS domain S-box protein [Elusimicrobiota bacterium]